MSEKPTTVIDPVCGMRVDVAAAEAEGLTLEHDGRMWAFCRRACRDAFMAEPGAYVARAEAATAVAPSAVEGTGAGGGATTAATLPVIDEGFRRWYENCACCLSDAYPEVKAQLDAERAAAAQPPVAPGICEVAEAG